MPNAINPNAILFDPPISPHITISYPYLWRDKLHIGVTSRLCLLRVDQYHEVYRGCYLVWFDSMGN